MIGLYISNLYIINFRSIRKENIEFKQGKNVLVGKNNAGKTNIVKALDMLLGEKHPSYIEIENKDFYSYKESSDIKTKQCFFLAVRLGGNDISESEIKKMKGASVIELGRIDNPIQNFFNCPKDNDDFRQLVVNMDYRIKKYYPTNELLTMLTNSTEIYIYLFVAKREWMEENFIGETFFELEDNKKDYSRTYSIIFKHNNTYYRCGRFTNAMRDSLITSAILPSFRDPNSQFRINSWNWYGKLIKSIWDNEKNKNSREKIDSKLDEIKSMTDEIFNDAIVDIKGILEKAIYHNSISFQLLQNTKDAIYKGINLFVDDGIDTPIYEKGSGFQSAMIISLFSYYCQEFHKNSSLLVVEEPEIYLHPQARRVLSDKFDEFVNNGSHLKNQVIATTHSTEFIRNTEIENIIVVRKSDSKTEIKRINADQDRIKDIQKIKNILWNRNAEIFFADKVILVEGGEEHIIPLIADYCANQTRILDYRNISVANVGGKSYFKPYVELLNKLDIEWYVLADFDILHNGIEDLKDFISSFDLDEINLIKSELEAVAPNDVWVTSREIKKKALSPNGSIDAKSFCSITDELYYSIQEACVSTEEVNVPREIADKFLDSWDYIRPKVKQKVTYSLLKKHPNLKEKVFNYIDRLRGDNIYILKKGELENYITYLGEKKAEELKLTRQKELKIIKLAELINLDEFNLEDLFDIDEHIEMLKDILGIDN